MKKAAIASVFGLSMLASATAQASNTPKAKTIGVISYSADSQILYFYLEGYATPSNQTQCTTRDRFGIRTNEAKNKALIEQVRMAFLSGKPVKVYWKDDHCVGSSPAPHYIKVYK